MFYPVDFLRRLWLMGLREQKKNDTRQLISDIATGMFMERGFEQVTIAEIAEVAKVSKMTVINYFPRKEDLYLDRDQLHIELLSAVITERSPGTPILGALREFLLSQVDDQENFSGTAPWLPAFFKVIEDSPALQARVREQAEAQAEALTKVIAAELDLPALDPAPRVLAQIFTATNTMVFRAGLEATRSGLTQEQAQQSQRRLINRLFDLYAGEMAILGSNKAPETRPLGVGESPAPLCATPDERP
ncbi:TetR family transcriptional regulator [Pseudonocardiaceae bacterium YIM PH 21723]|nr:TetR family transcriptional regulator [Pseudonocardiaceae bacterium YIM PH 21723]